MEFSGFDWDDANREKFRKHGMTIAAIERLFLRGVVVLPDAGHSQRETRLRAIGRTQDGRTAFVVFTLRDRAGAQLIRPISARYMHKKEIDRYAETCKA